MGETRGLWRYRDRLPVEPLVTLGEGDTPLVPAPHLSELTGCQVWLKLEGANPTGSFKDRGMTVAVSAAVREGAEVVVCASTGNTAASAAAYAARAGLRGAVIVPEGKIATGKLAQALMHGARVVALRGNFDEALTLVRELAKRHPIALVNSVNEFRIEGQKTGAFEVCDQLGEPPDVLCIPVGNAGNVTAWWRGFQEYEAAPRLHGYQAEGAAPLVRGAPVENPETVASAIRIGNPARWEDAMSAFTSSRGEVRAVSDDEILDAYSLLGAREGVFCEPASAASVAGLLRYGAEGTRGLRAHRARAQGPADGDEPGRVGGAVRAGHRQRGDGRARDEAPPAGAGAGVVGQPRAGLRRARGRAVDRARAGGGEETGEFAVESDVPGVPLDRSNLCVRAFEALHPADGLTLPDPLGDPAGRGARARARPRSWRGWWPPTTCTSSTRRCSSWPRELEGHPDNVAAALLRRLRDLRGRRAGALRPAAGARGRAGHARRPRCRTAEARAALPAEVPMADAVHNVAHAVAARAGPGPRRPLARRARPERPAAPAAPARASTRESMELVDRAAELGAVGATISGAGPTVLFWCHWQDTGALRGAAARRGARTGTCGRATFAPGGADVTAL